MRMTYLFSKLSHAVVIVCLFPLTSISQSKKIDSLKSLLPGKSLSNQTDILSELAYEYVNVDYQVSFKYASGAFEVSKQSGDSLKIVRTGRIKSQILRRMGNIDAAVTLFNEILPIARRRHYIDDLKTILNGLGVAYVFQANYDKALKCHFESLELREKNGDKYEISSALHSIGLVYYKLKDYDKALQYYHRVLSLREDANRKDGLEYLLVNISLCYAYTNNFSEARSFLKKGIAVCEDNCAEDFTSNARFGLGVIYFGEQNFPEAETEFLNSYRLAEKLGDGRFQLDNIVYLLQIYIKLNKMKIAEKYLHKAEVLMSSNTPYNLELIKVYSQLFQFYTRLKNFEKVAYYQNNYITLKDSIYDDELTTNLMKVEAEHLEKENKAKIAFQNIVLDLNKEVILRQRFLNVFIGIIAILLIVLTLVLLKSNRQKRMVNHLLDEKVKERTRDLELNRDALQRACEARDALLHKTSSDINNSLATLKGLYMVGLKDVDDPRARQYFDKMNTASDNFSVILRNLHLTKLEI